MTVEFAPPLPSEQNLDPAIARIRGLPYFAARVFLAKNIKPERFPHFHYKYRAPAENADSTAASRLRDILVDGRLWLSSPRDFNDPFDMTAKLVFPGDIRAIRARFEEIARRGGEAWKKRKATVDSIMANGRAHWEAVLSEAFSNSLEETGVFSFAGDPRSILMWSHYGAHHAGLCIQFEIARDTRTLLGAVPVDYHDKYPTVDWVKGFKDGIGDTLTSKLEHWKYEGEWRIVWPNGARKYARFDPSAVVGLIYGCRASPATVNAVRTILRERVARGLPPVKEYRAVKHEDKYALRIQRAKAQ